MSKSKWTARCSVCGWKGEASSLDHSNRLLKAHAAECRGGRTPRPIEPQKKARIRVKRKARDWSG